MKSYSTLPLGEKIYEIRKAKGLSQENMAQALNTNRMTISRIERGETECSAHNLALIRQFLDIEKTPLLEHELQLYEGKLRVWYQLVATARGSEAKAMQEEMAIILDLPFEADLYQQYLAIEAWLLCKYGNISATEDKLNTLEPMLGSASATVRYLFHLLKGFLYSMAGDNKKFLKHSIIALNYRDATINPEVAALYNISQAYLMLGKPFHAIVYLERAQSEFKGDVTNTSMSSINHTLASCYVWICDYDKAEKLAEASLAQAKSLNATGRMADVSYVLSNIKLQTYRYEECMAHCEQAILHYKELNESYIDVLIVKAHCLLEMNEYEKCKQVLAQGKAIIDEEKIPTPGMAFDEDSLSIQLNATGHLMTLDSPDSINYIQNTAIPQLRDGGLSKFEALYFCNKLEAHYTKKRTKTKANAIAAIARDIYREIYEGEVEFD